MGQARVAGRPSPSILAALQPREDHYSGRSGHIASGIANCMRHEYFDWVTAQETNPPTQAQRSKMQAGVEAEERHALRLGKVATILERQTMINLECEGLAFPIHGKVDLVVEFGEPPVIIAEEYKSTEYSATQAVLQAPRVKDMCQLWTYLRAGSQAAHFHLVYQDRGSQIGAEYEILDIDDTLWYRQLPGEDWVNTGVMWGVVVAKLKHIERCVADRRMPDRLDPITGQAYVAYVSDEGNEVRGSMTVTLAQGVKEVRRSHWMCSAYCGYRDLCWLGVGLPKDQAQAVIKESLAVRNACVPVGSPPLLELPDGTLSFDKARVSADGTDG